MADIKQKHEPGPDSGYREQPDPRGQPGEDLAKDGRQLPEETDEDADETEGRRDSAE